jgi:hypothetical protein
MSAKIDGNFYGQDFGLACREAERLNNKNNGHYYEVDTNMSAGGYQILEFRKSDDECLGYYDDGDQWSLRQSNTKGKYHEI